MDYYYISDFFTDEWPNGGAEIADKNVMEFLISAGHTVNKIKCSDFNNNLSLLDNKNYNVVVSNFANLSENAKEIIIQHKNYIIYEHDFKMFKGRDINNYSDHIVPPYEIVNLDFYKNAKKVIVQSTKHLELIRKNINIHNLISAKCNPWSDDLLDLLEVLSTLKKNNLHAITKSPHHKKNTIGAIEYALHQNIDFAVISPKPNKYFLAEFAQYQGFLFFPLVFETFSRVSFEAKALNLNVIANKNISFLYEDYAVLSGIELIKYARNNNKYIVKLFTED